MSVPKEIVIVGAGVFGLSTAIALAKRHPKTQIHVVDRMEPPVVDGTSVDTSRVLRIDYVDRTYSKLAARALEAVKNDPEISPLFHQVGLGGFYDGTPGFEETEYQAELGSAESFHADDPENIVYYSDHNEVFKGINRSANDVVPTAEEIGRDPMWNVGYINLTDGFIDAAKTIKVYYDRAKSFKNVHFVFKAVEKIDYVDGTNKAKGVVLEDKTVISSELVIICAGAWSCGLVDLKDFCKSTSVEIAWIKLTKEEEAKWKDMSICFNFNSGVNLFPPYGGEIKILGKTNNAYVNTTEVANPNPTAQSDRGPATVNVSIPRTKVDNPSDWIPEEAEESLRATLRELLPEIADRPFDRTKMCWTTDTTTGNFLVDYHPELQNVLLATGGTSHGFKFIPLIGDLVVDFLVGKLEPILVDKWSWEDKLRTNFKSTDHKELSAFLRSK